MDRDGDGVVTRSEWQGSTRAFRLRDANRDGVLEHRELSLSGPWLSPARGPRRW
jgi:hypothetical protein